MVPKSVRQVIRQQKPDTFEELKQVFQDCEAKRLHACAEAAKEADTSQPSRLVLHVPTVLEGATPELDFGDMFEVDRNWSDEEKAELLSRKAKLEESLKEETAKAFGAIHAFLQEHKKGVEEFRSEARTKRRRVDGEEDAPGAGAASAGPVAPAAEARAADVEPKDKLLIESERIDRGVDAFLASSSGTKRS